MLGCSCVLFYGIFRFKSSIMAWASARKLEAERSPQYEEEFSVSSKKRMASASESDLNMEGSLHWVVIRKQMHRAIEDGNETGVRKCLDTVPALRMWLDPDRHVSARYKAIQKRAFRIHVLLVSRDCALKDNKEASCYDDLSPHERAEIRRQRFFATEYKESYIHYLKSKSLSQTPCADFEARLERMYTELISVGLISTILKVAATAPRLEIHFDFKSENVQRTTGCRGRSTRGLTFHEDQKVFIAGSAKEEEIWGTFTHEMSHLALYLVYRNNGKPYFRDDTEREHEYKAILNDIKRKENECIPSFRTECGEPKAEHPRTLEHDVHLLIQQAFFENEEEELIVRVAHVLAEYGSHDGNIVLERDVPELYHFFKNVIIPDMQTCIENRMSWVDFQRIEVENARLQRAFNTGKLNVVFETPLKRSVWENRLLHIFTGPELRLLEIMVHNAVQSTGQPYLFFEVHQWDSTLTDVLLDYKCAFVLVTVHPNEDVKSILEILSYVPFPSEAKVILLVEDSSKEDLIRQVDKEAFFVDKYKVHEDVKASFEHVTRRCKEEVFTNSRIKLQGQDATAFPKAMNIETFLRYIDTKIFLELRKSKNIDLGPPLHELEEGVKNYYVERVCRRAAKINIKEWRLYDKDEVKGLKPAEKTRTQEETNTTLDEHKHNAGKDEVFDLLGCPHDSVTKPTTAWPTTASSINITATPFTKRLALLRGSDDYTTKKLLNVNEKVVVLSGAPGMGKSVLASRLCSEMKKQDRNRWVLHVDLPQRLASIKTTSFSVEYLAKLCQVQKDGLEFALFEESLNNGSPFEVVVVLDAFDEINDKCRKDVLELISFLSKTKVYKIYIFTRTVFKSDLQDALNTVSYELVPFSDENQKEFLTKYRQQREDSRVSPQFQKLYKSLTETTKRILETPLLLRMMAEIESGEIAGSDYSSLLEITNISDDRSIYTVHIYKMFVEYKYLVYRIEKRKENIRLHAVQQDDDAEKPLFYADHGLLAMNSIFPDDILAALLNKDELEKIEFDGSLIKKVADNRLKEGFVSGLSRGIPEFFHKTFAEFFAAHYLLEKAKATENSGVRNEVFRLYGEKLYERVMLYFDGLASASFPLHSAVINNDASYFEQHIQREDMFKLDELRRTPLHVAALHANTRTILEKLPMDDELIKYDMLDKSPIVYAEICSPWDPYEPFDEDSQSWETENSGVRERLDILCARCSGEAVKHSNETLRKYDTFEEKRRFVIESIFTAVRCDLKGVLAVYLRYFPPKERSSRCSADVHVMGDLDRVTDELDRRTVAFYAKSEAVCKMLLPYCDMGIVDRYGNTILHISAKEGNLEATQFHLARSSVDVTNKENKTPLHLSAEGGHEEVVQLLLPLYTSVNVLDARQETPMDRCAESGHLEAMKMLLLRTRIDAQDIRLKTPHVVTKLSRVNIVECLLPHTPHTTARTRRCAGLECLDKVCAFLYFVPWNFDVVRFLIPHSLVNSPDTFASSPVYIWARGGQRTALQTLWPYLRHSHPKHAMRISRYPVCGYMNDDFKKEIWCLKLLLLHLDVIAADRCGRELLYDVIKKMLPAENVNFIIYMKLLLPHSNLRERDRLWRKRLKEELMGGTNDEHDCLRLARLRFRVTNSDIIGLRQRWSEMNNSDDSDIDDRDTEVVDEDVNRMLLISAREGDVERVKFYLSHSSVYITDEDEDTALHLSARNGHTDVVHGDTPMHVCARNGHLDIAKLLLLRSPLSCINKRGGTPVHVASKSGALDIVTFLLPHSLADMGDVVCNTFLYVSMFERELNVLRCLIPHSLVDCPKQFHKSPVEWCAEDLWSEGLVTLLPYCGYEANDLVMSYSILCSKYSRENTLCVKVMVLHSDVNDIHDSCFNALDSISKGKHEIHAPPFQLQEKLEVTRTDTTQLLNDIKLLLPHSNLCDKNDEDRLQMILQDIQDPDFLRCLQRWTRLGEIHDADNVDDPSDEPSSGIFHDYDDDNYA